VRPTAGIPLAFNKLTKSGTSVMAGVTNGISNFGTMREVAGAASRLALQTQPSITATAGVAFAQQPIVEVRDQFGNLCSAANGNADNGRIVTALRSAGGGVLQGQTNAVVADGRAVFANLYHTLATNITVGFSSGILSGTTSVVIAIAPGLVTQLFFASQPAAGTVGTLLSPQTLVCTCDAYGNKSAVGLPASKQVSIWLSAGAGSLLGATSGDIGATSGNGLVSFTNLSVDCAGSKQLSASADGLGSTVSSLFTVAKGNQTITFSSLGNKNYGDPAFHVSAVASSGLPVTFAILSGPANLSGDLVAVTGSGTVSIRAQQAGDSNWNAATQVDQSFSVAKATLTVTVDNQSRVYGAPNPTFTASYSGFVNGDDATIISGAPQFSTAATATSSVSGSPYLITGALGSLSAANYSFNFASGSLTVTKATLTVTAEDKSRVYGATNPPLTASYSGFVNGETTDVVSGSPSLSTTATPGSPVTGSAYSITVGQGTLSAANYSFNFVSGSLTVTKATLTVTADNKSRAYGATNPPLTASYSGFVNGETTDVLSGSPSLSTTATPASTVAGAPYPVTPTQGTLNAANYSFNFVSGLLTVNKATLTVVAENKSRVYGAPDPIFTASYSGFVNGEDATVISGAPQLSTTAMATSSVAGSPYAIAGALGSLSADNYNFGFVDGQLSISAASSSSAVASSANPACTGSNVTFIATVAAVAPGSGNPNGAVQFKADGSVLGLAVTLSNGIASISSSSLSHGTHQITAEYSGDGNFLPSTNALGTSQIIDLPPTALLASYQRQFGSSLQIPIQDLLTNFTSDADGDALTLLSVGAGTNGATISISGDTIVYQPSATDPNRNTTDCFSYSISDGFSGGIATNKIRIDLTGPDPSSQPPWLSRIQIVSSNVILTFTGVAGYSYHIERTPAISSAGSSWTDIGSATTDNIGNAQFTDTSPIPGQGFYRVVWKQ
jgi:hypothetical protein